MFFQSLINRNSSKLRGFGDLKRSVIRHTNRLQNYGKIKNYFVQKISVLRSESTKKSQKLK